MKKDTFSFVKYLTKTDVKKILKICGYEINEELPTPYNKFKSDDGKYYIIVKCRKNELSNTEKIVKKIESFMFNTGLNNDMFGNTILDFSDFMLTEFTVSFDEEESLLVNKQLTQNYHKFMQEKFGKFYNEQKRKYINALNQQENEKEENI